MEDVLYDYHIAQSLASSEGKYEETNDFVEAVFKKHGITSAEFDSSMVWYTRHTKELNAIYSELSERMRNKAGVSAEAEIMGDTTSLWNGRHSHLLFSQSSAKAFSFKVKCDTSFHQYDRITMKFYSRFMSDEMPHNAVCALVVNYEKGFSQSTSQMISMSCLNNISVQIDSALSVKSITGFIYINGEENRKNVLLVDGIHMYKMHNNMPVPNPSAPNMASPVQQAPSQSFPMPGAPVVNTAVPMNESRDNLSGRNAIHLQSSVPVDTSSYSKDRPEYNGQPYPVGRLTPREERNMRYSRRVRQNDSTKVKKP